VSTASDEPSVPTPRDNQVRWLRARKERAPDAPAGISVGVAASFTAEPLEPQLGTALIDAGYADPEIHFAEYNQLHQVCLDPGAVAPHLDVLILLWRIEDVFEREFLRYLEGDDTAADRIGDDTAQLAALVTALDANAALDLVVSMPPYPAGWNVDLRDAATTARVGRLHRRVVSIWLDAIEPKPAIALVDLDALQRHAGEAGTFDAAKWAMYRQPFRSEFWMLLGAQLAATVQRRTAPPPKCIVLDCDNTLWGGIVGEDGIGGIELGDAFPGRAFQEFQRQLHRLRTQGVMLAVVSKNNEGDVLEVFERHEGMVLTGEDITAWRVNWEPKPENIASIVAEVNIGADSVVFVDDNPVEIDEARARVPGLRCLLVPEELADLPSLLAESGLFRGLRASAEDKQRTEMMQSETERRAVAGTMSRDDFLASLGLRVSVVEAGEAQIARVAQLTQKTNQFNLTTIRRTEKEIRDLVAAPDATVYAAGVSDRFGDYGIVGVAIVETGTGAWTIDTFLLSCRVLGRGVERAFLAAIASDAAAAGAPALRGRYEPTRKNGQVAGFFADHGFDATTGEADEARDFTLDLGSRGVDAPAHIELAR